MARLGQPLNYGTVADPTNYGQVLGNTNAFNARIYDDVLQGYQHALNLQSDRAHEMDKRYQGLSGQVLGYLSGAEDPELERIQRQYDAMRGEASQSAAARGLGNWTIADSMARGIESDRALARSDVASKFGQLRAGYASDIGLTGLGYIGQSQAQQDAMRQGALQFMGSFREDTPDPLGYAQLAQQQKQWQAEQPYLDYETIGSGSVNGMGGSRYTQSFMIDPKTGRRWGFKLGGI